MIAVVCNLSLRLPFSLKLGHLESLSHPLRSVTLLTSICAPLSIVLFFSPASDAVWEKEREDLIGMKRLNPLRVDVFLERLVCVAGFDPMKDCEMKGPGGQDTPNMAPSSLTSLLKVYKPRLHRVHFKVSRSCSWCSSFKVKVKAIQTFGCFFLSLSL